MVERMWNRKCSQLLAGLQICTATLELGMVVSQKIGNLSEDPVIALFGEFSKDTQLYHKDTCSTVFIAEILAIG